MCGVRPIATEGTMPHGDIDDVHRRIRNILDHYPASDWTLEESLMVLDCMSRMVRARQTASDVVSLTARRALS